MSKSTVLVYVGNGSSITLIPARDLTASDLQRLNKEGITTESLLQSQLYEYPPAPAGKAPTQQEAQKGKE